MKYTTYFQLNDWNDIWAFRKNGNQTRLYLNDSPVRGTFGIRNYWSISEMTSDKSEFHRISRDEARRIAGKYFKNLHAELDKP